MKLNILYIADPNSIHDIKWISYFSNSGSINAYLISQRRHFKQFQKSESKTTIEQNNITVLKPVRWFSIIHIFSTIKGLIHLKLSIKKFKINILHIMYAEPNALWCLGKRFLGVPIIVTCRGTDILRTIPETFKKKSIIDKLIAPLYRVSLNNADVITGTSELQLSTIEKLSGRRDNVHLIRTGVDLEEINQDSTPFLPNELIGENFLLFPRYMKPIYNHEFCIEAINILPKDIKQSYKMVFLGKDCGDEQYTRLIKCMMNDVQDVNFVFLKSQSQKSLFELYKKASLVIMTPLSDGSPVSAMEAIACGTKVILGPLKYDDSILDCNVEKLKEWNSNELKNKILISLAEEKKDYYKSISKSIERKENMEKLKKVYLTLALTHGVQE